MTGTGTSPMRPWPLDTDELMRQLRALQDLAAGIEKAHQLKAGFDRDLDAYALKIAEEVGEAYQAYLQHTKRRQSNGQTPEHIWHNVENQTTDVLMYLLVFCRHAGVDLHAALERKWFCYGQEAEEGMRHL